MPGSIEQQKEIPKHGELNDKTENLCSHEQTLKLNLEHVKELFPEYFSSECDFDDAAGPVPEDVNTKDLNITSKSGNFNIEAGMWKYPSLSQHKPMEMHDVQLVESTKMRNATSIKEDKIFTLKPCPQSLDGSLKRQRKN